MINEKLLNGSQAESMANRSQVSIKCFTKASSTIVLGFDSDRVSSTKLSRARGMSRDNLNCLLLSFRPFSSLAFFLSSPVIFLEYCTASKNNKA